MNEAGSVFFVGFFSSSEEWRRREGNAQGGKGKAAEKDGGKESKFFPQMWFTSWSGKTSVWTILHTHAAALLHTYTEKKKQCAHPHRRTSKMTTLPYTCCTPLLLFLLSGEKHCGRCLSGGFRISVLDHCTCRRRSILHAHAIRTYTRALAQAYLHTGV